MKRRKSKGFNGEQLEMFEKPRMDEILIRKQIDKGFFTNAFEIMKATGAKTSAAIFFIMSKTMQTDWGEIWEQYENEGFGELCRVEINGVLFQFICTMDTFFLVVRYGGKGYPKSIRQFVTNWSETDVAGEAMTTKIKGALLKHLDKNSEQFNELFRQYNELPF